VRLFILGANGKTGTQLVDVALARAHEVTPSSARREKITRRHPSLTVRPGDPHRVTQLAGALPGHDVVLSALGVRPPEAFRPHTLVQECAASTVAAMTRAGVKRLLLVSAAVLFPEKGLRFAFFRWVLTQVMRDLGAARADSCAPRLSTGRSRAAAPDRPVGRPVSHALDALPARGFSMSFREVAAFMLDAVEHRDTSTRSSVWRAET